MQQALQPYHEAYMTTRAVMVCLPFSVADEVHNVEPGTDKSTNGPAECAVTCHRKSVSRYKILQQSDSVTFAKKYM